MYNQVCSLGTICHTARIMQRIQIKPMSYPFDWVFSDEEIIIDCLSDDFNKFLDQSYYVEVANKYHEHSCGHTHYHEDFFFHKDPRNQDHYEYYQRCVNRFRDLLNSNSRKLFLMFISPENTKHPKSISDMVENEVDRNLIMDEIKRRGRRLDQELSKHTSNYKLVVITNFGGNEYQTYEQDVEGTVDFVTLNTINASQGVTFNGGWNTNRHPDNYYTSGLLTELYPCKR